MRLCVFASSALVSALRDDHDERESERERERERAQYILRDVIKERQRVCDFTTKRKNVSHKTTALFPHSRT